LNTDPIQDILNAAKLQPETLARVEQLIDALRDQALLSGVFEMSGAMPKSAHLLLTSSEWLSLGPALKKVDRLPA
jgi:hypothetical protein